MSTIGFLFAWANAPFVIAGGIAALFALLQVTGILGVLAGGDHAGGHEAGHDIGHDVSHDLGHDVEHDHDVSHDHDAEHDHDADDGAGARLTLGAMLLGPVGFGRIPLSIIWQSFSLLFGLIGLGMNLRYFEAGAPPVASLAWTLPVALLGGYAGVALLARVLGPVLSSKEQEATSRNQLVGLTGVVISTKVDAEFGEVRIRDKSGHDLRVVCRLASGAKAVPKEHQTVVVVDCTEGGGEILVEPLDLDGMDEGEDRRRAT